MPNRKQKIVKVNPHCSIREISKFLNEDINHLRILHGPFELLDRNKTFAEYGISDKSFLNIVLRLRGGSTALSFNSLQ